MSLASPEFGRLIVHLFDLCSSPPPLLDVMGNTKTVSGWKNGTHVPRPQTLDAALASMKSKVGYNRWPRRRVDAFDHIARQLQLISRMHQHDGYAVFSRIADVEPPGLGRCLTAHQIRPALPSRRAAGGALRSAVT